VVPARPATGAGTTVADLRGCRICIVDDHEATLGALRELLRADGFDNVLTTTSPATLLEEVEHGRSDLVILDLRMESVDGLRLMEQIEERRPSRSYLPILMLTAEASADIRRRALSTGAHDLVLKPFDPSEVLLRIRNLLTTRSLHVELDRHRLLLERELHDHQEHARRQEARLGAIRDTVEQVLEPGRIRLVFQPIFGLRGGGLVGAECLSRFEAEPVRPPNEWFADADEVGLGAELELASVRAALGHVGQLPDGAFLAVNVSAEVASSAELTALLVGAEAQSGVDVSRIVVELTEHAPVVDYERLQANLDQLRRVGVRIAIDDAGAGYASFQHILRLRPDFIKLDLDLTRGIDSDPVRRALASALVTFGGEIGSQMIAEGVERREELSVLADLGFAAAQGYYLGRPNPLPLPTSIDTEVS
jgi:EAL domain-containing protein (putative c-di-GMP-specific phosphodiesterase class I)/AmiR/NasT family two-component response regulator